MKTLARHNDCMTIVVPVYNRPTLVVRCLESLKSQTYRPIHVIVVDNASTDDTVSNVSDWISTNKELDFSVELLSESRRGAAYAREKGLIHVNTDKVMFFDSDDTMRVECVENVMRVWSEDPEVDIVAWPVTIHTDGDMKVTHPIKLPFIEHHLVHAILRTQGYAVKTDFIRRAGGWRGEFPNWNDLETGTRILLIDPKVRALSEVYVDVYPQKESITGVNFSDKGGKWEKSLDGIEKSVKLSSRQDMDRLLNIISYRRAILAAHYAKEGRKDLAFPLYQQSLSEVPKKKRLLIRFAYHWTKSGFRGAFSVVGPFL